MTAFNIVRFRVKPGHEQKFIAAHRDARAGFKGFRGGALVRTGEHTFCVIGEWANFAKLVNARRRRRSRAARRKRANTRSGGSALNLACPPATLDGDQACGRRDFASWRSEHGFETNEHGCPVIIRAAVMWHDPMIRLINLL
ncbi:MAG: antibiotic biosynthesis monooxygenase [Rhizobiales bacterium]|nr:antibiotic biosynthesis monooxygenase [Hyphomicrobiales bacterium]